MNELTPVPDAPNTIAAQIQQLSMGQRRAVLVTSNGDMPKIPNGMKTLRTDQGTFVYNPALTSTRGIKRASAQGQLNRILGPTDGGTGPQSKEEILTSGQRPVSVVGQDAQGTVTQATLATPDQTSGAAQQVEKVTPPGGTVKTESPEQTVLQRQADMAASGIDLNRGSATKVPLSPAGHHQARDIARKEAARGGFDKIETSTALRARQTAQPIAAANPKRVPVRPNRNLESRGLGATEGQPRQAVQKQLNHFNTDQNAVPPGVGPLTDRPGESRNAFRSRLFPEVQKHMAALAQNPQQRVLLMMHSQGAKELKGWVAAGMPDDYSVKDSAAQETTEDPGAIERLWPNESTGKWEITSGDRGEPGIYIGRHAATPINKESYGGKAAGAFLGDNPMSPHLKALRSANDGNIDQAVRSLTGAMSRQFDNLPQQHQDATLREIQRLPRRAQLALLAAIQPHSGSMS